MKDGWFIPLICLASACDQSVPTEEAARETARLNACMPAIKNWIIAHAEYPDSYEALSFGEAQIISRYRNDTADPEKETYVLRHTHRMRSIGGDTTTYSGYFILDNDLNVVVVESARSGVIGGGSDPNWKDWTDIFGKPMTTADTAAYRERAARAFRRDMEDLSKSIDVGDAYAIGTDPDSAKALIDSITKQLPK